MYLGEITRNILVSLIDAAPKPLLFGGKATGILNKHYGLDTSVMSNVEEAWEGKDNSEGAGPHTVPAFATFDDSKLSPGVKSKLERIRVVVVKEFGHNDAEVSLRDAAVRLLNTTSPKMAGLSQVCRSFDGRVRWWPDVRPY
jgi:hexokinase